MSVGLDRRTVTPAKREEMAFEVEGGKYYGKRGRMEDRGSSSEGL